MRILQVNYGDFGMRPKHGPKQEKTEMRKICIRRVLTEGGLGHLCCSLKVPATTNSCDVLRERRPVYQSCF